MGDSTASQSEPTIVEAVREWLSVCDSRHSSTCTNACNGSTHGKQLRPSHLIDVKKRCVVDGNVEGQYVALSYTWQTTEMPSHGNLELQLCTNNVNVLTLENSLEECSPPPPKVILDAIELTDAIGVRYLWVDRLCIHQDNPAKVSEFECMDRIYAGAYMTIVAAAARGMFLTMGQTIDSPAPCAEELLSVYASITSKEKAQSLVRAYYREVSESEWAERAWTYQEYILSRRVVFFLGGEIFWQCECAVWDLHHLRPRPNNEAVVTGSLTSEILRRPISAGSPDFGLYADLICPYNGRELSFPEDGLFACLGILNQMTPAFPDGFVFGMPRLYFAHALLWQPLKGCYEKRVYEGPQFLTEDNPRDDTLDGCAERNNLSTRRPSLPSWAWCGWKCFVDPKSFESAFSVTRNDHGEESITTSWKLKSWTAWQFKPSNHRTTPVHARHQQSDTDTLGVSQFKGPVMDRSPSPLDSNLISARTTRTFLCPAATLEIRDCTVFIKRARTLRLFSNPVLIEKPLDSLPKVVVVQDQNRKWAGLIRITGDSKAKRHHPVELIVISQGSANGRDLKSSFEERVFRKSRYHSPGIFRAKYDKNERWDDTSSLPADQRCYKVVAVGDYEDNLIIPDDYEDDLEYDFYNVLWVERGAGDVAYRAGCGRVMKDCWEVNNPTQVEITLG
ncbi:hypothetical protein G7054_g10850 [Neopestalotiopsis clavispora]|nr:hypothetical protein G7054_g10850 [Neopestalotiopsis clavispora]